MRPAIEQIDPANEPALRAWWEVGSAAEAERAYDAWPSWERTRRRAQTPQTDGHRIYWLAIEDRTAVGQATAWFFGLDNTHLVYADVLVAPEHRRQGVGSALVAEVEAATRAAGRTTVSAGVHAPLERDNAGARFAEACGYPIGGVDEIKLLDLPDAMPDWGPLDDQVSERIGEYRIEVCDDRISDDLLEPVCAMLSAFMGEIPLGELDIQPATWTPARLRDAEARRAGYGEAWVWATALAPDGSPAGYSDLIVSRDEPRLAHVGGTLVMPGHRGHRLGLALKLASHRRLAGLFPDARWIDTGNAQSNTWMNRVNEQLGYRLVERSLELQKRV